MSSEDQSFKRANKAIFGSSVTVPADAIPFVMSHIYDGGTRAARQIVIVVTAVFHRPEKLVTRTCTIRACMRARFEAVVVSRHSGEQMRGE